MGTYNLRYVFLKVFRGIDSASSSSESFYKEILNKSFYTYNLKSISILFKILAGITIFLNILFLFLNLSIWLLICLILCVVLFVDLLFVVLHSLYILYIYIKYNKVINDKDELKSEIFNLNYLYKLYVDKEKNICITCKREDYCYVKGTDSIKICNYYINSKKSIQKKQENLKKYIEELEGILNNLNESARVQELEGVLDNKESKAILEYKKAIDTIESKVKEWVNLSNEYKTIIKTVLNKSKEVIKELESNPSAYPLVQLNFNVYLLEIVQTVNCINNITSTADKYTYYKKLKDLIDEYIVYSDNLIEKIKRVNLQNIEVSINTLLKDMQGRKEKS